MHGYHREPGLPCLRKHILDSLFREHPNRISSQAHAHPSIATPGALAAQLLKDQLLQPFRQELGLQLERGRPLPHPTDDGGTVDGAQPAADHTIERRTNMLGRVRNMGMVDDGGGARGQGFERAAEVAPEGVGGAVERGGEVAGQQVLAQHLVAVTAFELRLPEVMVRVDETGAEDLGRAVDDLGRSIGGIDRGCDLGYSASLNQDIGSLGGDIVFRIMLDNGPAAEQDRRS